MRFRGVVVVGLLLCGCDASSGVTADATEDVTDALQPDAEPPLPVCTMTFLRPPADGYSTANAIDASGNIAGTAGNTAFRWHESTGFVDLGTVGEARSIAYGISGAVTVGVVGNGPDDQAFLSDGTGMHLLPMTHAYGVNASGVVVGDLYTAGGSHAVKYEAGVVTQLGTMITAFAITDAGVIAGYESNVNGDVAVTWTAGTVTALGPGRATAINQAGDTVVGATTIYRGGMSLTVGFPNDITPCNFKSALAFGANDNGWVVGSAFCQNAPESPGERRPTLYRNGVGRDINGLLTNPPLRGDAVAVNNAGQIAGNFRSNTGSAAVSISCVTP